MTKITETSRSAPRPTYRQDWPNYNLAQTREKREFQELLFDLCQNHLPPVKRGRAARRCFLPISSSGVYTRSIRPSRRDNSSVICRMHMRKDT